MRMHDLGVWTQSLRAMFDVCVFPPFVNCASMKSVPGTELAHVNVALPLASVIAVPVSPTFGPEMTLNVTTTPGSVLICPDRPARKKVRLSVSRRNPVHAFGHRSGEVNQLAVQRTFQRCPVLRRDRLQRTHDELRKPDGNGPKAQQGRQGTGSGVSERVLYLGRRPASLRHVDGLTPQEASSAAHLHSVVTPACDLAPQGADGRVRERRDFLQRIRVCWVEKERTDALTSVHRSLPPDHSGMEVTPIYG